MCFLGKSVRNILVYGHRRPHHIRFIFGLLQNIFIFVQLCVAVVGAIWCNIWIHNFLFLFKNSKDFSKFSWMTMLLFNQKKRGTLQMSPHTSTQLQKRLEKLFEVKLDVLKRCLFLVSWKTHIEYCFWYPESIKQIIIIILSYTFSNNYKCHLNSDLNHFCCESRKKVTFLYFSRLGGPLPWYLFYPINVT